MAATIMEQPGGGVPATIASESDVPRLPVADSDI